MSANMIRVIQEVCSLLRTHSVLINLAKRNHVLEHETKVKNGVIWVSCWWYKDTFCTVLYRVVLMYP